MSKKNVENALKFADETKFLAIDEGILREIPTIFKQQFPNKKAIVIADNNTYKVAGEIVHKYLSEAELAYAEPFLLTDSNLLADYKYVIQIVNHLKSIDAIAVAVGAGVVNDLTKRANSELDRPYMCVATAASMDGYSAYGSSITKDGTKMTMTCPAPQAIVADLSVICKAPAITTASGYTDLYAKITAGADWIVADALGIEAIDNKSWHIVQDGLEEALCDPAGAKAGDIKAIEPLTEGLMLGGFAIQSLKSSRPASGSEHQFSHLWDMEHHTFKGEMAKKYGLYKNIDEQSPSHGFKVGIGILSVTALYERIFAYPIQDIDVDKAVAQWKSLDEQVAETKAMFEGEGIEDFAAQQITDKYVSEDELRTQLTTLKNNWSKIKANLQKQIIPYDETKRRFLLVGAPTQCEEIGVSREKLRMSFVRAQRIRNRFTVLDLAVRLGLLDTWLDELFGEGGALK